jgi:quercetin dioxygenase-like cupin family protein
VVLSGRAKILTDQGQEVDLTPGDFFHVASDYDSWVVGYRPCQVLYLSGVETLVRRLHRE